MSLVRIAGTCSNGINRPTVYARDDRAVVVQGHSADVAAYRRRRDLTLAHARRLDGWLAAHRHELQERRRTA